MSRQTFIGGCVVAVAAVAGCYTGGDALPAAYGPPTESSTTVGATVPAPAAGSVSGVPCDVAQVLASRCASCHGVLPSGGAPNTMMSYEDLVAASASNPSVSIAEISIARMRDTKSPMPPDGASATDLAAFERWFAAGMPKETDACDVKVAPSIYDTPTVCTSDSHWTRGDHGSVNMRPGGACIDCHERKGDGPTFYAAGTVFATAHEPDDCNGVSSSSVKVVITDAAGRVYTAAVNGAGNFFFDKRSPIKMPYKAKVVSGTKSRVMSTEQTDGDCNRCHTETGLAKEKSPGRVMAP